MIQEHSSSGWKYHAAPCKSLYECVDGAAAQVIHSNHGGPIIGGLYPSFWLAL